MLSGDNAFRGSPCRQSLSRPDGRQLLLYLRHGLRRPNAAGVWGVGHGTQNSLLACAHRILTTATPFCSLFPPPAALANVPLYTREPFATQHRRSPPPKPLRGQADSRHFDRSRQPTGDPRLAASAALPPPKPLSGQADSRCFDRSRQMTGDPRPAAAAVLPPPKPLRGQAGSRHFQ